MLSEAELSRLTKAYKIVRRAGQNMRGAAGLNQAADDLRFVLESQGVEFQSGYRGYGQLLDEGEAEDGAGW